MITENVQIKSVVLRAAKCVCQHLLDEGQITTMPDSEVYLCHVSRCLVLTMERDVWREELGEKTYEWPATWLDAVKVRWCPFWLLKKYPAKMTKLQVGAYRCFPGIASSSLPDKPSVMKFYTQEFTADYKWNKSREQK